MTPRIEEKVCYFNDNFSHSAWKMSRDNTAAPGSFSGHCRKNKWYCTPGRFREKMKFFSRLQEKLLVCSLLRRSWQQMAAGGESMFFWEYGHWYVSHASSVAPPRYICAALIRISGCNTTTTKHKVGKGCIKDAMKKMRECRNHNHIPLYKEMKFTRIKKKI